MCKLLVSYNTLVRSELGYLVRQLILISWKSGCRQTHLSRGTQKESTTISYLNLTELTLTSVDFGLDVGFGVVISFYNMKTSLNHTLFLVFFVLFCPRILWANVLCFLFFLLFSFLVHQPFWPLSSLLHLNGQTEKNTSFSPILILFWLISQYTLTFPYLSETIICFSALSLTHAVLKTPTLFTAKSTSDFLLILRVSLYLAAISVPLLHLTISNIWKADQSLKPIWLTLSGNSLVPL